MILLEMAVEKRLWGGERVVDTSRVGIGRDDGRTGTAEDKEAIRGLYDLEEV